MGKVAETSSYSQNSSEDTQGVRRMQIIMKFIMFFFAHDATGPYTAPEAPLWT